MSSEIRIPDRLAEILRRDRQLHGCVMLSLEAFEPWLRSSGMPLFPEYTDHGPQHVEDTLTAAESLIADAAYEVVTSSDVSVLILSILVHDCAMHLDEASFIAMVTENDESFSSAAFDDRPWGELWHEFLGDTSRFDARKLIKLFGDQEPVRRPPVNPSEMTKRDRLLIGGFVRRYHHRIAHQIAQTGIPKGSVSSPQLVVPPDYVRELVGVVARSHGLPLRYCVDVLRRNDHHREYKGVHPTFLMGLLRIADYLQIQSSRAPQSVMHVKHLQSPLSVREWDSHAAVMDIRHTHEDPESLFVEARPENVRIYLRLREWIDGIQREMDNSWALLGEVYGRYEKLKELGFLLRRVRSNIDDIERFSNTVSYIPCSTSFEAANPDLLKLLVGPLYANRIDVAFRELVQNAVDAVRERNSYSISGHSIFESKDGPDVEVVVEEVKEDEWWVSVKDQGIGMTLDTIRQYFLKVGASFRSSDVWRLDFEGADGNSRVLRSGRFGVGVLAAFLLGNEIQVSTRHVSARPSDGFSFSTSLDEENIEIRHATLSVGTTIRIRVFSSLSGIIREWLFGNNRTWDYSKSRMRMRENKDSFCLSDPVVKYTISPKKSELERPYTIPLPGGNVPPEWHVMKHPDYDEIQWTYSDAPDVSCNGIIVVREYMSYACRDVWWREWVYERFYPPKISVFDSNGKLPLSLQRDSVAMTICPFSSELLDDVVKDYIAFILVYGPTKFDLSLLQKGGSGVHCYQGISGSDCLSPWLMSESGFLPMDSSSLISHGVRRVFMLYNPGPQRVNVSELALRGGDVVASVFGLGSGKSLAFDNWLRLVLVGDDRFSAGGLLMDQLLQLDVEARSTTVTKELVARYDRLKQKPLPKWLDRSLKRPWSSDGWMALCNRQTLGCDPVLEALAKSEAREVGGADGRAFGLWELAEVQGRPRETRVSRAWAEYVGVPVVPYDLIERKRLLSHSYDLLREYVEKHEMRKEQELRKRRRL